MDINKVVRDIERQIAEYLKSQKAIIGISGGIDSAVVAYLCVNAIGKENVIGVLMPYGNQSVSDSELIVKELGIESIYKDIKPIVSAFAIGSDKYPTWEITNLVKGNMMARIRMVLLYAIANSSNGIVVGTTNRTEAEVGYYTKHGDGGVDIEPIEDLYKTEIWEAAKILGVPDRIITKTPSAELWDGQTDEGDFGMSYKEMDHILQTITLCDGVLNDEDLPMSSERKVKVLKVKSLIKRSEHKRHMPPIFKVRREENDR